MSSIRLSHTLPINSQKVANKSVKKLLKSCYFFYLFALEVGVVAVFTGRICLDFSFSTKVAENIFKKLPKIAKVAEYLGLLCAIV